MHVQFGAIVLGRPQAWFRGVQAHGDMVSLFLSSPALGITSSFLDANVHSRRRSSCLLAPTPTLQTLDLCARHY